MHIVYDFWPFWASDKGVYAINTLNGFFRYPGIDLMQCNDSIWIVPGTVTD